MVYMFGDALIATQKVKEKCYKRIVAILFNTNKANIYMVISVHLSDINECASSPCQNNATCEDSANGYHCSCMLGYTGDYCETGKECYFLNV